MEARNAVGAQVLNAGVTDGVATYCLRLAKGPVWLLCCQRVTDVVRSMAL
jgi:hypothetical protein